MTLLEVKPETNTCIYMYREQFPIVVAAIAKQCLALIWSSQVLYFSYTKGTYFCIFFLWFPSLRRVRFLYLWREIPLQGHTHLQSGVVSPVGVEHDCVVLVGLEAKVHVPGADLGVLVPNVAVAPKPHSCSWKKNERKVSSLWHLEAMDCIKLSLFSQPDATTVQE